MAVASACVRRYAAAFGAETEKGVSMSHDEKKVEKRVEFKLNKESTFELSPEEKEEDGASKEATFICCIGCNTSGSVTSGCPT
jgi:hypothetical protein